MPKGGTEISLLVYKLALTSVVATLKPSSFAMGFKTLTITVNEL